MGFYTYRLSPLAYCLNTLFYLHQTKSIFRPTSSPFLALWLANNKSKQIAEFCQNILPQVFAQTHLKGICTFSVFLDYTFRFSKFCKCFCIFEITGLFKNVYFFAISAFFIHTFFASELDFTINIWMFANLPFFSDYWGRAQGGGGKFAPPLPQATSQKTRRQAK